MEHWLLLADPDSKQIYTLNTVTNQVHIELDVDPDYRGKAMKDIEEIHKLLKLHSGNWLTASSQVENYRRRKLPSYLLHKQSSLIPIYLSQSTLSLAFAEVNSIRLRVSMAKYAHYFDSDTVVIEVDAGLVTSVDEVIKNILRECFTRYRIKVKPEKTTNQFILQVKGLREYLSGNYPMLQFDRVRVSLRGLKFLEVILTEVPKKNKENDLFPPIIKRQRGVFEPIDWNVYKDIPVLIWYAPYKLPSYESLLGQVSGKNKENEGNEESIQFESQNVMSQPLGELSKEILQQEKLLFVRGGGGALFLEEIPRAGLCPESQPALLGTVRLAVLAANHGHRQHSADLRGGFRAAGQTEVDVQRDHGAELHHEGRRHAGVPAQLGQEGAVEEERDAPEEHVPEAQQGQEPGSGGQLCADHQRQRHQVHRHRRRGIHALPHPARREVRPALRALPHFAPVLHLPRHPAAHVLDPGRDQEGSIIPYSMTSYRSPSPTRSDSTRRSPSPASRYPSCPSSPVWPSMWSPTRSKARHKQFIIGATIMYIFDENMLYRQGNSVLNIWPFYQVDPRFQCQGQYWGLQNNEHPQSQDLPQFLASKFSRLSIRLDTFAAPLRWSLRSNMEQLNHPTESLSVVYLNTKIQNDKFIQNYIATQQRQGASFAKENYNKIKSQIQAAVTQVQQGGKQRGGVLRNSQSDQQLEQVELNIQERPESLEMTPKSKKRLSKQQTMRASLLMAQSQNYKSREDYLNKLYPFKDYYKTPRTEDLAYMQTLLKVNPLDYHTYNEQDKYILMICRHHYKTIPYALQIFLRAIDWADPCQVRIVNEMLQEWAPLPPQEALPLLDAIFADENVRLYAVDRISQMPDDELALYMLEFTQALMFEKNINNPLGEMLLERSLQNPWVVGHELFWLLRSQLHVKPSYERFALLLEQLLMLCGSFRTDLLNEVLVNDEINTIAATIKNTPASTRLDLLRQQIVKTRKRFPSLFSFALDARMGATDFKPEKCKVLDSKKLPLWLVLSSQDDAPIMIIFKNGDDIRQDLLTLQLIKIMDKIWLDAGMDFRMKPYKVAATEDQVGMIEVVRDSVTTSGIHEDAGAFGAFDTKSILNYIKQNNPDPQSLSIAIDNFLRSCAGYCVATFILGIGDRHSGNIMLAKTGHLFHIDFGHFLGNFKSKYGIKRERTAFVFTQEMAFVMGGREGKLFKQFEEHCTNAYNMVRRHGMFLINIFLMNLSAGMPELQFPTDVKYLEVKLAMDISDQEATAKFRQEIASSLNDTWRRLDNLFHNMKRKA